MLPERFEKLWNTPTPEETSDDITFHSPLVMFDQAIRTLTIRTASPFQDHHYSVYRIRGIIINPHTNRLFVTWLNKERGLCGHWFVKSKTTMKIFAEGYYPAVYGAEEIANTPY